MSVAFAAPCSLDHREDASGVADGESERSSDGDGCCPGERGGEPQPHGGDDPGGDHEGCSCPIDCGPCCGSAVMHALPGVASPLCLGFAAFVELPSAEPATAPHEANSSDILHVPLPR